MKSLGLDEFQPLWEKQLERVDQPNRRGKGWSEVCRLKLSGKSNNTQYLYIKRQQDYGTRQWSNIFSKKPTFQVEYENLLWCAEHGIPTLRLVAYGQRQHEGAEQAVLVTAGLDDYLPLTDAYWLKEPDKARRRQLLSSVARQIFNMHRQGKIHNCLYPKHIFVHKEFFTGQSEIRLIDLEKAKPMRTRALGIFRDLDSLNRRAAGWNDEDRQYFFDEYYAWGDGGAQRLLERLIASCLDNKRHD